MTAVVREKLDEIIDVCETMQLKSLCLFGSGASTTDFNRNSDLDFLFQFQTNEAGYPLGGYDYFDLLSKLEQITGKKIDLVAEEKVKNRFF